MQSINLKSKTAAEVNLAYKAALNALVDASPEILAEDDEKMPSDLIIYVERLHIALIEVTRTLNLIERSTNNGINWQVERQDLLKFLNANSTIDKGFRAIIAPFKVQSPDNPSAISNFTFNPRYYVDDVTQGRLAKLGIITKVKKSVWKLTELGVMTALALIDNPEIQNTSSA